VKDKAGPPTIYKDKKNKNVMLCLISKISKNAQPSNSTYTDTTSIQTTKPEHYRHGINDNHHTEMSTK
jgi:hypothetical protein